MFTQSKWRNHFQEHKTLFMMLVIALVLVELEIFALAVVKSGRESKLQVIDHQNALVYEAGSYKFDPREKAQFENTFGPLSNYQVKLVSVDRPFPFRAWFAAAVGLPIGGVLLFGFFVRAYEALFFKDEPRTENTTGPQEPSADKLDRMLARISRLNIFAIGGFVLLFAVGLFAGPHLLSEFGRYGVATISKYRWFFLGAVCVFLGLVIWIIFLRYLLARKAIETQGEVEKYRLQLEILGRHEALSQITGPDSKLRAMHPVLLEPPAPENKDRSVS